MLKEALKECKDFLISGFFYENPLLSMPFLLAGVQWVCQFLLRAYQTINGINVEAQADEKWK